MRQSSYKQSKQEPQTKYFFPDWLNALRHSQASAIGYETNDGYKDRCECCYQPIMKNKIPLTENTKQLSFLGFGFPLYFAFVRNCILLLMVTICSYNIISLYEAIYSNDQFCKEYRLINLVDDDPLIPHATFSKEHENGHENHLHLFQTFRHFSDAKQISSVTSNRIEQSNSGAPVVEGKGHEQKNDDLECTSWMVFFSRVDRKVGLQEQIIRGASFIIHLILLVYIKDKLTKLNEYFDERNATLSDYAIMVKDLPEISNIKRQLTKQISENFHINNIAEIVLIPALQKYEQIEAQRHKLIKKLRTKVKKQIFDEERQQLQNKLSVCQQQQKQLILLQRKHISDNSIIATRAILIVSHEQDKHEIIQLYKKNGFRSPEWASVKMEQAPQPKEIIWENISLSQKTRTSLTIMGWILSIILLVILTAIFAVLSKQKSISVEQRMGKYRHEVEHDMKYFQQSLLIVFGMIFFVVLFNKIVISTLFHKFTDMERHSSTFRFQLSFCLKYCLGLFFTTALMTLFVEAVILENYYKHDYGVIQEESIMYFINSLFVPLFWLVNPAYLYKKIKQKFSYGKVHFTQQEANQIMELPNYDIGKRYAQVMQIMWFTFLYMSLIPIGGFISLLGLILYYWIDKYNLLRRSSVANAVSGKMINFTLRMLDMTLVFRAFGDTLFDYQIREGIHISSIFFLFIAIIYQFMPVKKMIRFFNHEKFNHQEKSYAETKQYMKYTYYDSHRLYSTLAEDRKETHKNIVQRRNNYITSSKRISQ